MTRPTRSRRPRKKPDPPPLSVREIRFCQGYADHGIATRAYLDAGFPAHPSNPNATEQAASRLVRNRQVAAYLKELRQAAADAAMVTVEELAQGFRRAVRADVAVLFGPDGEMRPPAEWPPEIRSAVVGVEVEEVHDWQRNPETGEKRKVKVGLKWKVKLENKTEARKVLAQWKRMLGQDRPDGTATAPPQIVVVNGDAEAAGDAAPPG